MAYPTVRHRHWVLDGTRPLGRKTIEWRISDHPGPIQHPADPLPVGYGFGPRFTVRLPPDNATIPGAIGRLLERGGGDFIPGGPGGAAVCRFDDPGSGATGALLGVVP